MIMGNPTQRDENQAGRAAGNPQEQDERRTRPTMGMLGLPYVPSPFAVMRRLFERLERLAGVEPADQREDAKDTTKH
jgi:hypothetical protein